MAFLAAIPILGELFSTVLKRVLPAEKMPEADRAKLEAEVVLELSRMDLTSVVGQLQINLEEAKSEKWWKAGWRPHVGWVCGFALSYHFIMQPLMTFVVLVAAWARTPVGTPMPPLPTLDISQLVTILLGMLGIGAMRSYEKTHNGGGKE